MGELNLVINNLDLRYSGIFRSEDIFRTINRALEKRGYSKTEKRHEEVVTENGRNLYLELRPAKSKRNDIALSFRIKIRLHNVRDVRQEIDGYEEEVQQGDVHCVFDAWFETDYFEQWDKKPFYYFLNALVNKFFYQLPPEPEFRGELQADAHYIHGQVKALLASYRRKDLSFPSEKNIREEVNKGIREELGAIVKEGGA